MAQNPIQWFPGHMAKTRRMMKECMPKVDVVLELLDARIPRISKNPEVGTLTAGKPHIMILTKATLADPRATAAWIKYYDECGTPAVVIDSVTGDGIDRLAEAVRTLLQNKLEKYKEKGMEGRTLKAMIVGIPNVGKSSLINRIAKEKKAKVENRPGVTLDKQWVKTSVGLDLLDMPGVLWPKFEDQIIGQNLAITGAIRDQILDTEEIAMILCTRLMDCGKDAFLTRYKLDESECEGLDGYDLFELVGRKRGLLIKGGEVNHERCASMLLEEFRSGTIGRITLELPERDEV